jgi:hypothetical protein
MYRADVGKGAATADVDVGDGVADVDEDSFVEPPEQADRVPRAIIALSPTRRVRSCFLM